ncbi:MAG: 30S ribosomal protein S12 methylthiotransferase RimO [candidate division Zixibacteria bacterium]|nr:30S ribosomal protein S12 methylthiotransferase RimO [candidate division Zixibacteria bacterium]
MKIFIKKLGCPKNDVDGDYIAGECQSLGHEIMNSDALVDGVIINTCGFILPAKEESIAEIARYEKLKKDGELKYLYVTGCLSQRYNDMLKKEFKNVDGFFGLGQIKELAQVLSAKGKKTAGQINSSSELTYLAGESRYIEPQASYAYLKISDGCDRFCSYCAIPYIRGRYRSRPIVDIVQEARLLAQSGKREIILVSQEGSGYGQDFKDGTDLLVLLRELETIAGIKWIRLMYLHPESISDHIIDYIASSEKVLPYFDIPLQHISDKILAQMNRQVTRADIETTLRRICDKLSNSIIRTTFIAGFPGETDKEFSELRDFISDFEFDRLGVFKYSQEEGTPAAQFDAQVPERTKDNRLEELMILQQEIAFRKNMALLDTVQRVIIDKAGRDAVTEGRTIGDCPDIDQTVFIKDDNLSIGQIINARIIKAEGYDLVARVEVDSQ